MSVGKPLHLRLFLEGEEVPVIAAQVSINLNAPAAASIQVVPLDEALDLKPRTMVHLFFLDSFDRRVETKDAGSRLEEDRLNIPFLDNYKLLFGGEVIGFQFVKTPNSRAVVLQCLDFSSYWDTAHATAIEYGPNGNAFTHQGALRASNTGLFDDIVNTTSDQLVRWMRERPLTEGLKNISGLAGGVIRMLEMIGGVSNHHRGVNDFFTVAELRCRVLAQIVAEENDNTAANLLKVKVFDEWLRNGLQNIGQQISFRDMLKLLFGYIHYDVIPNPTAKFDASFSGTTTTKFITAKLSEHPQAIKAVSDAAQIQSDLQRYIRTSDAQTLSSIPGNYKPQLRDIDSNLASLQAAKKSLSSGISRARASLSKAINALEMTKNPKNSAFIQNVLNALDEFIRIINESKDTVSSTAGKISTGSGQRLRSQIIRPDCFFSPPPRCNVIFPEQYTQLSYDRLFLSEVTRSLVLSYNTLVGKDALLADRILAPSVGIDTELLAVKSGKEGYRALMKHELHTGIIPRSEWLPNTSSFSSAKTDPDKNSSSNDRVSWGRKIALFHFFKYRFGPRTASVGSRFNPYLVCGFPALIIVRPFIIPGTSQSDSSTDAKTIELILGQSKNENSTKAPSQLVGMIGALSHSLDQNGGSTSISMHHVRQHLGVDDEFIGVFLKSKGSVKKRIRVVLNADKVAISSKQLLKDVLVRVTPQSDAIPRSGSAKRGLTSKVVQGQKTTIDVISKKKITTPTSSTYQVIGETSASEPFDAAPPLTERGRIDKIDRMALVPSPPGKLTINGKGVFGKIIGIEVVDASLTTLQTQATTSTQGLISAAETSSPSKQNKELADIKNKGGPSVEVLKNALASRRVSKKSSQTVSGQVFKEVILYEEIDVPVQTATPIEEIIRPKWFSQAYSNAEIGKKIYQPFLGVPSIIDEAAFDGLGASSVTSEPNVIDGDPKDAETDLKKLVDSLSAEEEQRAKLSIERSVNFISYIYGLVKARGLDVDDFIRQYANRPIATLPEMLGDPDLDLTVGTDGTATVQQRADGTTPRIGFHSLAVHPKVVDVGNLAGLLEDPNLHVQRINNSGKAGPIPPQYDVRKEKKDRVRRYIAALGLGPGFRG